MNSSAHASNAQRLPNGNTLICEGDFGRLFEVTAESELVWEYVNPYFNEGPNGLNNRVFRAYRYSAGRRSLELKPQEALCERRKNVTGPTSLSNSGPLRLRRAGDDKQHPRRSCCRPP